MLDGSAGHPRGAVHAGVSFLGTVFLWLDGACNYLWGTALALLPLLIIPRLLEKECAALGVIGVPLMLSERLDE